MLIKDLWIVFLVGLTLNLSAQSAETGDTLIINDNSVEAQTLISESNELNNTIKRVESFIRTSEVISTTKRKYRNIKDEIEALKITTTERLETNNSIRTVRELLKKWDNLEQKIAKMQDGLQTELSIMEKHRQDLENEKTRWTSALDASIEKDGNSEELKQYRTTLKGNLKQINEVLSELADSTSKALGLSSDIIKLISEISTVKEEMSHNQNQQFLHLFEQTNSPLWSRGDSTVDSVSVFTQIKTSWNYTRQDLSAFIAQNKWRAVFHLFILALLLFLFYYARFNYVHWDVFNRENLKPTILFLSKPLAASFFIAIFLSYTIYSNMPVTVSELNALLAMIPLLFILPQLVNKEYHRVIYVLAVVFALDQFNFIIGSVDGIKRFLLLGQGLFSLVGCWMFYKAQSKVNSKQSRLNFFRSLATPGIFLLTIGYSVGLLSNVLGYANLSVYLTRSLTFSLVALLLLYILLQMGRGLFTLLLYGKLSQVSNIIRKHQHELFKTIDGLAVLALALLWLRVFAVEFGFYDLLKFQYQEIVSEKWEFGQVSITIQNVLDGIMVMVIAWYLGLAIRFLLEDEILPRITSKRGLPAAVGISLRYLFISIGFILAVASLGLDLNKLGFIAGALSVGIGFGLQNVVGNFISGLILLFERPVVPGDVVQLDKIEGVVQEIGLRSSKVKTWEGAEVIIPNMDLISKSVINLTLTDKKRRVEKILETEKDADPSVILENIRAALITHPEILADPGVQVLFKGQYSNYYRFRILYWITGNVLQVDSDVNLLLNKALEKMQVRIAIPESKISISGSQINKPAG